MSRYTFTFKKDNIFVEFTTEDRDVVERQFQIWVADADAYARGQKAKPKTDKTINEIITQETKEETEPALTGPKEELQQAENTVEQAIEVAPEPISEPAIEQQTEAVKEVQTEIVQGESEQVFDQASNFLKTINSIQKEQEETVAEESPVPSENTEKTADFEAVLEKSIENPTFEPEKTKDPIFLNLVKSKSTTDKFHYLMITAYYLSEFEKMERFSLKQINAKLMQNLSELIDHTMLQDAIGQNLIELVPDLTGASEVGEYRLTAQGEEFFANQI